jgi:MFS family permease
MSTPANTSDAAQMRRHARAALIILTFINLFNYIDRYVFAILGETLKKPTTLGLTDGQLGWIGASFMVVYALTSPVFGTLGDRQGRSRLIASGVAIWSVGTMLGGFARGFWTLLGGRSVVGVGEAAYGSIAPAVLSDHYPKAERGRVLSIFYIAIPVGAALGYILGGEMDHAFGWRAAFFIAGAPGLVLALLLIRLRDPKRGTQDDPSEIEAIPHGSALSGGWPAYKGFFHNRPYMGTVLGYAAYTFGLGAMSFWMPMFLQRVRGFTETEAGTGFGKIVVVTGLVGTLAGGWLGDRLLRYTPRAYLYLAGVTTLIAAPLAYAALTITDRTTMLWTFFAVQLLLFASTGPVNSAILNAVIPTQRATAMAFSILMIHLLGDVPSPILIGNVSLAQGDNAASLQHSLIMFVPPSILVAGLIWMATALWPSRAKAVAAG